MITRVPFIAFCIAILASGFVFSDTRDQKAWIACEMGIDCTSIEIGCWQWKPVNKNYIDEMKAAYPPNCDKSFPAGPQPTSSCVNHSCINNPYTGQFWKRLEPRQASKLIDNRIDECLTEAAIKINRTSFERDGYGAYIKQVGDFIEKNPSVADKSLDEIISSQISCKDVKNKDKEIKEKWSKSNKQGNNH